MRFSFAQTLRRLRLKMGVSQAEMADLSGLTQSKVSQLENGRVNAETSTLQALAAAADAEVMIVPRLLVPKVQGMIEDFIAPARVPAGSRFGGIVDELFVPDEEEGEDESDPSPGRRP